MEQTIAITVSGKVQGVFYRQSTKEKAIDLNITGKVKNLTDGRVFIVATGSSENINALIQWCWDGPRRAVVSDVEHEVRVLQHFDGFSIER